MPEYEELRRCDSFAQASLLASGYEDSSLVERFGLQMRSQPPWLRPVADRYKGSRVIELACALQIAVEKVSTERFRVIDWGGGNGYLGVEMQRLLPNMSFEWIVVESHAVYTEYSGLDTPNWLSFQPPSCLENVEADLFLASGSLNYVENPWSVIRKASSLASHMLLMRLPILRNEPTHVAALQKPRGDDLYSKVDASLATWLFALNPFDHFLEQMGTEVYRWQSAVEKWEFEDEVFSLEGRLLTAVTQE